MWDDMVVNHLGVPLSPIEIQILLDLALSARCKIDDQDDPEEGTLP